MPLEANFLLKDAKLVFLASGVVHIFNVAPPTRRKSAALTWSFAVARVQLKQKGNQQCKNIWWLRFCLGWFTVPALAESGLCRL